MFENITKGISKQLNDIFDLHFVREDEKSEERKEKEKQINAVLVIFTKALNLIVYAMPIIIIMHIVIILVLNPRQGVYEADKLLEEKNRQKTSPMADTIRMKNDTIKMKNDSIRYEIAARKLKEDTIRQLKTQIRMMKLGIVPLDRNKFSDTSMPVKFATVRIGNNERTVTIDTTKNKSAIVDINYGENFSLWRQIKSDFPDPWQIGIMLVVLLFLLWVMKWIMQLFYTVGNLIAPFSILKIIGMGTLIIWIWNTATHLFAVSTLFDVANKINPL